MDDKTVKAVAFANLPTNRCALTNKPTNDPVVMHRDLSDWWPVSLHDIRDDRVRNLIIVDREARQHYYDKLKTTGVALAFSGGLDSTTVLHWCLKVFDKVRCLIFDYKQRHTIEISRAREYIDHLLESEQYQGRVRYDVIDMAPINSLANSSLTRCEIDLPEDRSLEDMTREIPNTFVPGRNIYFITALAQLAYQEGWRHVAMGVNVLDYSGYPDCRPEFLDAMRTALRIGVFNGIDIGVHAPLMYLNKKEIIRLGLELDVDYSKTHSCYQGVVGGCGVCDSCKLRRAAFEELGFVDPAIG